MIITILLTVVLVAVDLFTKHLATTFLMPIGTAPFIPGLIQFRYVLNDGMAFSLFAGKRFLLVGVTAVALLTLAYYLLFKKPTAKLEYYGFTIVLAGGIGNLVERALNGYVVDFLDLQFMNFAVFNIADCFVTIGMILVVISFIIQEKKLLKEKKLNAQLTKGDLDERN